MIPAVCDLLNALGAGEWGWGIYPSLIYYRLTIQQNNAHRTTTCHQFSNNPYNKHIPCGRILSSSVMYIYRENTPVKKCLLFGRSVAIKLFTFLLLQIVSITVFIFLRCVYMYRCFRYQYMAEIDICLPVSLVCFCCIKACYEICCMLYTYITLRTPSPQNISVGLGAHWKNLSLLIFLPLE